MSAPTNPPARPKRYDYGAVAFCYDELAALYSLGQIARSKQIFLETLSPGDSVLVAGAGRGALGLGAAVQEIVGDDVVVARGECGG